MCQRKAVWQCPEWDGKPQPDIKIIEKIARRCLQIAPHDTCEAKFLEQGNLERIYTIHSNKQGAHMRVVPHATLTKDKRSKVSTAHWLQQNTTMPVGLTFSSKEGEENELGYGWILQDIAQGKHLGRHLWVQMSWTAKQKFVRTLAHYHAQLLEPQNRFKTIGSIRSGLPSENAQEMELDDIGDNNAREFVNSITPWPTTVKEYLETLAQKKGQYDEAVDELLLRIEQREREDDAAGLSLSTDTVFPTPTSTKPLSPHDTAGENFYIDEVIPSKSSAKTARIRRSPFLKYSEVLQTQIDEIIEPLSRNLAVRASDNDAEYLKEVEVTISVAKRLGTKLKEIFPLEIELITDTAVTLPRVDEHEVIVNRAGDIARIQLAEYGVVVPIWRSYQIPEAIMGLEREDPPMDDEPHYRSNYIQWWKTKLRGVYLETIEELHPGFQERLKKCQTLNDIGYALLGDQGFVDIAHEIKDWLDEMESGNHYSLRQRIIGLNRV